MIVKLCRAGMTSAAICLLGSTLLLVSPKAQALRMAYETHCSIAGGGSVSSGGVTWIYPYYMECTDYLVDDGGSVPYYDDAYSGGGGGGGGGGVSTAPDRDDNPIAATCHSEGDTRYYHAKYDFGAWKIEHAPLQISGRGELIQIKYDDGGVELYSWIPGAPASPTAPPETYLARIPNSLRCPS